MKQILLFSAVLFIGLLCTCDLCAQSCQPNPACKVVCSSAKAGIQKDAAATTQAGIVHAVTVNQPAAVAGHAAKRAECDPTKCDPTQCDLSKCDPSKCDPTKCDPAACDPSKCIPVNGSGGAKAKSTRI